MEDEHPWLEVTRPDGQRDYVRLNLALTTVGRSEQNVLELLDPKLSRFHCEIERRGRDFFLRDCNSRNGTRVDDEPVQVPRRLRPGDCIQLGHSQLLFLRERPPQVARDAARPLAPLSADEETLTRVASRGPTRSFDPRATARLAALTPEDGGVWAQLARVAQRVLGAARRAEVIEETLSAARSMLQARGAYLGEIDAEGQLTCVGRQGLDDPELRYVEQLAARGLAAPEPVLDDRRGVALAVSEPGRAPHGVLAIHDLPRALGRDDEALSALVSLGELAARTLSGSLRVEEVRREERAREVGRIAQDLQQLLRPERLPVVPGLELGAAARGVGRGFWDALTLPERAGRRELLLALGAVPRSPPLLGLRRRGERGVLALMAQAELKGALRATVESCAALSEVLTRLAGAGAGTPLAPEVGLSLLRYDPSEGVLRAAGVGHPPLLLRRGGEVEALPQVAEPLGLRCPPCAERIVRWGAGDVLLAVSHLPRSLEPDVLPAMFDAYATGAPSASELAAQIADDLEQHAEEPGWDPPAVLVVRRDG
ncbi:MAG: FHA domain-containing protein [Planctomycetota bacterium]